MVRLSVEERRARLIEAAIGLAESKGVAAVTTRDVASAAGVSLGVVHYCFENKDALMTELVKALSTRLQESVDDSPDIWTDPGSGPVGLHRLVRGGLELLWLDIATNRGRQLLTYETTTWSLRAAGAQPDKLAIAREQYAFNDDAVAAMLTKMSAATGTSFAVAVTTLSRMAVAVIDGVVLRWLVDGDAAAAREQLDLLADAIAGYVRD